jgi:hypothetical protein
MGIRGNNTYPEALTLFNGFVIIKRRKIIASSVSVIRFTLRFVDNGSFLLFLITTVIIVCHYV